MARQMGSHISFLMKSEATYGVLPSGNWVKVPILSFDPGPANDIVDDPAIGFGHRESLDIFRGPISYKPKVDVPVDLNNIGYWLKPLLGGYAVTGTGPYTHLFKASASATLPSEAIEVGHLDANAGAGSYFDYSGCSIDTGAFDLSPTGPAKLSLNLIAQKETPNASSQGGTPTTQVYTPFSQLQGTLAIGSAGSTAPSTAVANITGATLNIANQLTAEPGVATGGLILGADAQLLKVTGDITVRFDTLTLYNDAINATNISLGFGYTIDVNDSLNFVMPRVALARTSPVVSGPGGVSVKFGFQAQRDSGSSASIIATLINGVASY